MSLCTFESSSIYIKLLNMNNMHHAFAATYHTSTANDTLLISALRPLPRPGIDLNCGETWMVPLKSALNSVASDGPPRSGSVVVLIKLKSAFRVLTRSLYPTCINVWKLEKAPCSERIFQNGDRLALVCSFFSCNSHGVGPIVPSSKDHVSRRESNKTPKVTIADFKDQGADLPNGATQSHASGECDARAEKTIQGI